MMYEKGRCNKKGQNWSAMTRHYNAEIEKGHSAQYDSSHYSEDNLTIHNNNPTIDSPIPLSHY